MTTLQQPYCNQQECRETNIGTKELSTHVIIKNNIKEDVTLLLI